MGACGGKKQNLGKEKGEGREAREGTEANLSGVRSSGTGKAQGCLPELKEKGLEVSLDREDQGLDFMATGSLGHLTFGRRRLMGNNFCSIRINFFQKS